MAARASAAAWGGAISWLACAETRVLALWPLDKKIGFLFSHRYLRYFLQKKARIWHTALSNNMLASSFRIVFFGVFCVCRISIVFCSVWAISRLSAHAGFDLQFSFFSVRGDFSESSCAVWWCGAVVGGVGGVFSFCFLHLLVLFGGVVRCGRGGGVGGGGGGADDVHANATCFFFLFSSSSCAVWWCGAVVGGGVGGGGGGGGGLMTFTLHKSTMQKPRVFAAFKTTT